MSRRARLGPFRLFEGTASTGGAGDSPVMGNGGVGVALTPCWGERMSSYSTSSEQGTPT